MKTDSLHCTQESAALKQTADDVHRAVGGTADTSLPTSKFAAIAGMLSEETRGKCVSVFAPLTSKTEPLDFDPEGRERP